MKKNKGVMIGLLGAALMVAPEGNGALSPLGGEFPLLGDVAGHQKNPSVALGQAGGFVVWQNMPANGRYEQVMVQRLGSDLTGAGVPARLSQSNSQGNELNPRATMLSDGGAAAVWQAGPRANTDVYVRILNGSGSFVTGALPANTYTAGNQQDADIAVLSNGNIVVVWSSDGQDGDGSGVYGQLLTSGGARIGGEFQVNGNSSMNQSDPAVTAVGDGGFVVAWVSEVVNGRTGAGAPNLRGHVMGRVYGADGGPSGNEYRLNDNETLASTPVLATGSDGGFTAAWTQRDEVNTRNMNDVYIRSFNSGGVPTGKSEKHNTHLAGQQLKPELVQLAGDALVAWTSYGQDASGAGVQGRLASGGTEFQVNSQGQLHQSAPTVATDGASKFLVVWVNTIQPSHSILSAQRYVTSDSALDGVVDVTAGEVQVVAANSGSRLTGTASSAPAASAAPASAPTVQINAPAIPAAPSVAAAPAPAPVSASVPSAPQAQAPTPARTSAPRSLASARANAPGGAGRLSPRMSSFAQQRSATAGRSMMQRMAQSRGLGRSGAGGRSTQMAARGGIQGRSLASARVQPGTRPSFGASRGGGMSRGSLASSRSNPGGRTAASALRGFSRSSASRSRGGASGGGSGTVRASLSRGNGGGYNLSWQSQRGKRYVVQGSNDLKSWNNVGSTRTGRGGSDSVQVGGANASRYYRVTQAN